MDLLEACCVCWSNVKMDGNILICENAGRQYSKLTAVGTVVLKSVDRRTRKNIVKNVWIINEHKIECPRE